MSAIYQEIVLSWAGKDYTVQPSFAMAQKIEARGISIMGVIEKIHRGEPPATQMAEILAHMYQSGGAKKVTPERVYEKVVHADTEEWLWMTTAITTAFVPTEQKSGNSEGLGDGAETETETETEIGSPT